MRLCNKILFEVMVSVLIRTFYYQTLLITHDQGSTTLSIGALAYDQWYRYRT